MRKLILTLVAICIVVAGGSSLTHLAAAATSNTPVVSISTPSEGQSVLESNVQVSGTAPAGTLIDINIVDSDTSKPFVAHQDYGQVDGSVTSDEDGRWVFTPQQKVVPGQYTVQAYFIQPDGQKVTSPAVKFVVITPTGSSAVLSPATIKGIIIAGGVLFLLLLWLIVHLIRRRHHKHDKPAAQEAEDDDEDEADETATAEAETEEIEAIAAEDDGQADEAADDEDIAVDRPLFLSTPQGRSYQAQQDHKLHAFQDEALKIEEELARTAEQLERANAEVISLRHRFADEHSNDEKPADSEEPASTASRPKSAPVLRSSKKKK